MGNVVSDRPASWNLPRLVIGAPHGHSGKTTISIGLVGAWRRMGHIVQPFKKGPDFIDPSWLGFAAGRPCRNLDCFWMTEDEVRHSLLTGSAGADIVVIEGAMGLFDGVDLEGTGSTAEIAKMTGSPVVLVVDVTRMTRSIAPLIMGFQAFDAQVRIAGVIFNKVARSRHEAMLRAAVREYCGVPVLGAVPKNAYNLFPERHLGLVPVEEHEAVEQAVAANVKVAEQYLDLKGLWEVAGQGRAIPAFPPAQPIKKAAIRARIGVMRDKAFTFYYPENLEALAAAGAELVTIRATQDAHLPAIDGLYIGGGFPEVYAAELEANHSLRKDIKVAGQAGMPVYAECGGLMYLGRTITWGERTHQMCGLLPFDIVLDGRPQGHGYTEMKVIRDNPFFPAGAILRGHEFHHSRAINLPDEPSDKTFFALQVLRGYGIDGNFDGILWQNVFAAYNHVHAVANPEWAPRFVAAAAAAATAAAARQRIMPGANHR